MGNAWASEFRLFPTLRGYRRGWPGRDLLAGMPPITGFYGFLVATFIGAAISTNRHLALGVDSTVAPIRVAGLTSLGAVAETRYYTGLAVVTAFLVGVFTLIIGIGRLGETPDLLGVPGGEGRTLPRIVQLTRQLPDINVSTMTLGLASLALSTIAMSVFKLTDAGVEVLDQVQQGLPSIELPPFSAASVETVLTTALVVAIFCLAQTAATTRPAASLGGFETDVVGLFTINASPPSTAIIAWSRAQPARCIGRLRAGRRGAVLQPAHREPADCDTRRGADLDRREDLRYRPDARHPASHQVRVRPDAGNRSVPAGPDHVAEVAALREVPFVVVVQKGRTERAFQGGGFSKLLGRARFFDTIPPAGDRSLPEPGREPATRGLVGSAIGGER